MGLISMSPALEESAGPCWESLRSGGSGEAGWALDLAVESAVILYAPPAAWQARHTHMRTMA